MKYFEILLILVVRKCVVMNFKMSLQENKVKNIVKKVKIVQKTDQSDEGEEKKRINFEQKEILVEFLEKHPELKSGKFTSTFTAKISRRLWTDVSILLNAVPCGAVKSYDQWKKVRYFELNLNVTNLINEN